MIEFRTIKTQRFDHEDNLVGHDIVVTIHETGNLPVTAVRLFVAHGGMRKVDDVSAIGTALDMACGTVRPELEVYEASTTVPRCEA